MVGSDHTHSSQPGGFQHLKVQSWKDKHHCLSLTPSLFLVSSRKGTENPAARKFTHLQALLGEPAVNCAQGLLPCSSSPPHPPLKETQPKALNLIPEVSCTSPALPTPSSSCISRHGATQRSERQVWVWELVLVLPVGLRERVSTGLQPQPPTHSRE